MKIVILDGAVLNPGDVNWAPIEALGEVVVYPETEKEQLPERTKGADVLLVNKTKLRRDDLEQMEGIGMVGVLATGYNTVEIDAFAERNIPVCNVVAYGVDDVAQHAFALLLEICRNTRMHDESVKAGEWGKSEQWCFWKRAPLCLTGLTMGIVGFGSIGRRMGELANAFGMPVLAHSRSAKDAPTYAPFAFASLDELAANSDVITLHCPLTPETRGMINADFIARMKPGGIVLNTARGPLIDEAAAAEALKSGHLRGLGTDVLSKEPPKADNALLTAPNTLITPHIAWATVRARQNIINLAAANIRAWKDGKPTNVVNAPLKG